MVHLGVSVVMDGTSVFVVSKKADVVTIKVLNGKSVTVATFKVLTKTAVEGYSHVRNLVIRKPTLTMLMVGVKQSTRVKNDSFKKEVVIQHG